MYRSTLAALLALVALSSPWACVPLREPQVAAQDDDEDTDPTDDDVDAGVDAGEDSDPPDGGPTAGTGRPADTVFAFGVTDNSGGAPQAAPYVQLVFGNGTPGPDTVVAPRLTTPITLDGDSADWTQLPTSLVRLLPRGAPIGMPQPQWDSEYALFGMTPPLYDFGITNAVVKAAYDDQRIYFLVEWSDATENRYRDILRYIEDKWVRGTENEDRLYFAFNIGDSFPGFAVAGCAAACHFKERLGDTTTEARNYRMRMHTNAPGELADVWSWRATTTNPMGMADDNYWDETGRKPDSATDTAVSNRGTDAGMTVPIHMSEDGVNANPTALFTADAGMDPLAVPYDGTGVVNGSSIPGYVFQPASPNRDDVRAVGRWKNGKWTVELSRALVTSDGKDAQFPLQ